MVLLLVGQETLLSVPEKTAGILAYSVDDRWLFDVDRALPCDGMIVLDTRTDAAVIESLDGRDVPVVRCHFPHDGVSRFPVITSDEHQIGRMGAGHLLELGLDHFAFAGMDVFVSAEREAGFIEVIGKAGFQARTTAAKADGADRWPLSFSRSVRPRVRRWLASLPLPIGVMAWNDRMAATVGLTALEMGLAIPDDIALLGVDNNAFRCRAVAVPLSSVDIHQHELGYQAAALLDRMMDGRKNAPRVVRVPPLRVEVRRSTDVLQIEDSDVAAAVRWLRDHAIQNVRIDDVEQAIGCSRATLDRKFRKFMGHSMGQELRQARLRQARELVIHSRRSMLNISLDCGFADLPHFSAVFKKTYGLSPSHYRQLHGGGMPTAEVPFGRLTPPPAHRR